MYLSVFRPGRPQEIYLLVLTRGQKGIMSLEFLRSYVGWQDRRTPHWKRRKGELGNNRPVIFLVKKKSRTSNSAVSKQLKLTREWHGFNSSRVRSSSLTSAMGSRHREEGKLVVFVHKADICFLVRLVRSSS